MAGLAEIFTYLTKHPSVAGGQAERALVPFTNRVRVGKI